MHGILLYHAAQEYAQKNARLPVFRVQTRARALAPAYRAGHHNNINNKIMIIVNIVNTRSRTAA